MINWVGIIIAIIIFGVGICFIASGANSKELNTETYTIQITTFGSVEILVGLGFLVGGIVVLVKSF